MADLILSFRIPEAKIDEYVANYIHMHNNSETKDDPNWNDPKDGSVVSQVQKYTDKQWVKEHIIRTVRDKIVDGRNEKEREKIAVYNADDVE